ncbi:hypothetical protein [Kitasatospora sp. GAS1066B]|uniref:hypothetical protein n=1 Tax=Kitasatospora sp. GAS1066B TaxID=3156271 RepID=UPI0035121228
MLIGAVGALPGRPVAIEAVWDGDTEGWFVVLLALTDDPQSEHQLALVRHGGDIRLFNGTVPPWPEAREAEQAGRALADHLGVRFHFPSPDRPDDEWATEQARNLLMSLDDVRTTGIRYLIRDNAGYFTEGFDVVFNAIGAVWCPSCPARPG